MRATETEIEMMQRHVCEGELIVARQLRQIAHLTRLGLPTEREVRMLISFEKMLIAFHNRLYRLNSR